MLILSNNVPLFPKKILVRTRTWKSAVSTPVSADAPDHRATRDLAARRATPLRATFAQASSIEDFANGKPNRQRIRIGFRNDYALPNAKIRQVPRNVTFIMFPCVISTLHLGGGTSFLRQQRRQDEELACRPSIKFENEINEYTKIEKLKLLQD